MESSFQNHPVNAFDTGPGVSPQKPIPWLLFGMSIVAVALIAGTAGYIVGTQKARDSIALTPSASVQALPSGSPATEPSASPTTTVSNSSFESSNRPGWVKYTNSGLGISFHYPIDQLELRETQDTNPGVVEISLFTKQTKNLEGNPVQLVSVSNTYSPITYGDTNTPDSIDRARYTIQGQPYDAWNFVMGEGNPCGGGSVYTAIVKLKEHLVVTKYKIYGAENKDPETCSSNEFNEFTTPNKDLELADTIIGTIEVTQ
jgi:hypothetical protein